MIVPPNALAGGDSEFEHVRAAIIPEVGIILSRRVPVSTAPVIGQVVSGKTNLHIFPELPVEIQVEDILSSRELVKSVIVRSFLEKEITAEVIGQTYAEAFLFKPSRLASSTPGQYA